MTPDQGDIIHLTFDPSTGQEIKGARYALVVSPKRFNRRFGLAMVCPISRGQAAQARSGGFLITLMGSGCRVDGMIHTHQLKALDFGARKAKRMEKVPPAILDEVLSVLRAIFSGDE